MKFFENRSFDDLCSLKVEENARFYCELEDYDQLYEIENFLRDKNIKHLVLGEGTNIVPISNFEGLVIKNKLKGITEIDESFVEVSSGENWNEFVKWSLSEGKKGLENLALIPGTVGAGPIQNIGAYGSEISKFIEEISVFNFESSRVEKMKKDDCEFGYRSSIFQQTNKYFILSVSFKFQQDSKLNLSYKSIQEMIRSKGLIEENLTSYDVFDLVSQIRKKVLPDHKLNPNVGSFFKNIRLPESEYKKLDLPTDIPVYKGDGEVKISSAYLIEKAGWKGKREGGVGISDLHSLVVVCDKGTNGSEILEFAHKVIDDIYSKTGLRLEIEPTLV